MGKHGNEKAATHWRARPHAAGAGRRPRGRLLRLQGKLGSQACADPPVPAAVRQRLALACTLRDQAGTKTPKAAQKLLRCAKASLKKAGVLARRAAKKHRGAISADCASAINGALNGTL